jgi:hypothetical protein
MTRSCPGPTEESSAAMRLERQWEGRKGPQLYQNKAQDDNLKMMPNVPAVS